MEQGTPQVSVVIPVYNVEPYLERCLESVTRQTYGNLEIILVDDGSTDRSGDICDRWAEEDSRIRVVHKKNAGPGMARNTGMEYCNGDYLTFVDSDDYIGNQALKLLSEEATQSNVDVLTFSVGMFADMGYAGELERFDEKLGELLPLIGEDDLLLITADHGNDPTHTGTDHTRETVPFLAWSPAMEGYGRLEDCDTFAVIGATIAENFGLAMPEGTIGNSILDQLK